MVVAAGAGVVRTGTGARPVSVELVAAFVVAAGVGAGAVVVEDCAEGELGDGLKVSKLELPVPAGSASFATAGSGALGTAVDLRPRL
jgi:hypothetical protein